MVKIETSKVKKGMILQIDGKLFKVIDTSHTHMGRGGATDTFKVKDIVSGKTNVFTYNAGTTLEQAEVQTNMAIFLYSAGDFYTFMENDTGEMYDLPKDKIDDVIDYLKENLDVYLMIFEGEVIGVILPNAITYTIVSTVPGVKGNRAQSGTKPAIIETGLEIQVPLHKNEGETVIVNTVTGEVN
ncbi:MAG TPA: elongation factor P [Candidatus Absconditabacterales bacterium]|nr:elongation factor P [Candidatus Absconditabacterales bacterium]HOQ79356.1 elongation factor P [Candidatus Absconditabacterales bacterium]HPK27896.1 elongation factor P [Candidatus Absconditabacterales bacterium]